MLSDGDFISAGTSPGTCSFFWSGLVFFLVAWYFPFTLWEPVNFALARLAAFATPLCSAVAFLFKTQTFAIETRSYGRTDEAVFRVCRMYEML